MVFFLFFLPDDGSYPKALSTMFNSNGTGGTDNVMLGRTFLFGFTIKISGAVKEAVDNKSVSLLGDGATRILSKSFYVIVIG